MGGFFMRGSLFDNCQRRKADRAGGMRVNQAVVLSSWHCDNKATGRWLDRLPSYLNKLMKDFYGQ